MNRRLLLVEDSPTQLITIRRTLESAGFSVITARSGSEGLVRAYDESPDMIISDVVMSGINGYQLCRMVKNDPEFSSTPVILLTKLDGSVDRFWGMKSGADRFIPKEPGFPSLVKAVKELADDLPSEPKLRLAPETSRAPGTEEINARLNQLLERLLFEATIIDEVRKLGEEKLELNIISSKLFDLLSAVLNYAACALVVAEDSFSSVYTDSTRQIQEKALISYVANLALQLGLPPIQNKPPAAGFYPENALTQPIDIQGGRLGLLIVV